MTIFFYNAIIILVMKIAGIAQLVERQPSKLNVASSTLISRSISIYGDIAQLGERRTCTAKVSGSIPLISTITWTLETI